MAVFSVSSEDFTKVKDGDKSVFVIKKEKFDSFDESILGLGDIKLKSKQINAISVVFDLEGFTNFCKQIDPHLAVPEFMSEFLNWIFKQVRKETIAKNHKVGYKTFSPLPFLSKYLGDGILFLWDTENMSEKAIVNVIVSMLNICINYEEDFYPEISKKIVSPPAKLRCGIARGAIYSVGNGNDFVGPCINMSARLQKLNSLSFCFSRRGLNPNTMAPEVAKLFKTMKVEIRGIGFDELVCVLIDEFDKLDKDSKAKFKEP